MKNTDDKIEKEKHIEAVKFALNFMFSKYPKHYISFLTKIPEDDIISCELLDTSKCPREYFQFGFLFRLEVKGKEFKELLDIEVFLWESPLIPKAVYDAHTFIQNEHNYQIVPAPIAFILAPSEEIFFRKGVDETPDMPTFNETKNEKRKTRNKNKRKERN